MVELFKELMQRGWEFDCFDGQLHIILGNKEYLVTNEEEAIKLYTDIKRYW